MFKDDKRIRIITICIIAVSLLTSSSAFASQKNETGNSDQPKNKTIEVKNSDYIEKSALKNLQLQCMISDALTIDKPKGTFVEYLVSSGQEVKKGDPLISYKIPGSTIDIEEKKIQLKQLESDFQSSLKQREEEITENSKRLSAMDSKTIDAKILELNIKKMKIAVEQYEYQTVKNMNDLREAITVLEKTLELQYIRAPYDGMVYYRDEIKEGTILDPGMQLINILDLRSAVFSTEAKDIKKLWYNMEVSIEGVSRMKVNKSSNNKGRIISVDSLYHGKESTGKVYVLPEKTDNIVSLQSANIATDSVVVKNVLTIPVKSVKGDDDLKYVYTLDDDGVIRKQYITGRDNGSEMWVYSGLSEGQRIVVE